MGRGERDALHRLTANRNYICQFTERGEKVERENPEGGLGYKSDRVIAKIVNSGGGGGAFLYRPLHLIIKIGGHLNRN